MTLILRYDDFISNFQARFNDFRSHLQIQFYGFYGKLGPYQSVKMLFFSVKELKIDSFWNSIKTDRTTAELTINSRRLFA